MSEFGQDDTVGLQAQDWLHSRGKRREDLILAAGILPLAGPAAVAGGLAVTAFDRVNPIYVHERLGYSNEPFRVVKLRTMPGVKESVPSGGRFDDPRASTIGRILRKTRIDEAPQLINVWRGEMSIFGPRPLLAAEHNNAQKVLGVKRAEEWKKDRALALPGIFDEFAIKFHDSEITDDFEQQLLQRIELERKYIFEEASLKKDMELFRKVWSLFFKMVIPGFGGDSHA